MAKTSENNKKSDYGAKDIFVLEGLAPVRKRPGMYIGGTGVDGLHHLIWEVVDNGLDEAMAGFAKNITISLLPQNRIKVSDDGRGIPVEIHKQTKKSTLETVMTTLHAGAKFGGDTYKIAGGLHGVGVSVVNALSKYLRAEVTRDGGIFEQIYEKGVPKSAVKKIGKTEKDKTGTKVIFEPDPEIFHEINFDLKRVIDHMRQKAYLIKGVKITILDEREQEGAPVKIYSFYFEGGIKSYIRYLNQNYSPKHKNIFYCLKNAEKIQVETALQYIDDLQSREMSFANNIHTPEGGMHLTGFRVALTRVLNDYARKNGFLKESEENFTGEDAREGLTVIISIALHEPQFEGQTKTKLGNPEARSAVENAFSENFSAFLEENPGDAKDIIEKVTIALKARKAAKAAKDSVLRKGALEGLTLPGKLADCQSRKPEESEIFIVEGDSAGGCFDGNTKIALTDGRNLTLKELIKEYKEDKKNYCYTIKNNGDIGIELIKNPRRTKQNTKVIKIILDNNKKIICTPDHLFMTRNGLYKRAAELTQSDSLMPFLKKYSKIKGKITIEGYEMVYNNKKHYWVFTHLLADKYNLEYKNYMTKKFLEFYKNNPEYQNKNNKILYLNQKKYWADKKNRQKQAEKVRIYFEKNPDKKLWLREIAKTEWQNQKLKKWRAEKTKEQWTEKFRAQRKKSYNQTYLKKALENLYSIYKSEGKINKEEYNKLRKIKKDKSIIKYETIRDRFFNSNEEKFKEAIVNYNHRIKKIIYLKEKIDVYDIEVPNTHNFALTSGVFVHNSAKTGRDRKIQAILPLKGKILNVEKARIDKMMTFKEIRALIIALGAAIGEEFNLSKLRYHKIIIATDADVDGAHIRTLLLTFFYRYLKPIIHGGYLYIATPPLYSIEFNKKKRYAYSDEEKEKIILEVQKEKAARQIKKTEEKNRKEEENEESDAPEENSTKGINIQRYKGLGEMNPEQLWETTMDPKNRILKQVNIEDAVLADQTFDILMGVEPAPRKNFIQTYAKAVKDLDI